MIVKRDYRDVMDAARHVTTKRVGHERSSSFGESGKSIRLGPDITNGDRRVVDMYMLQRKRARDDSSEHGEKAFCLPRRQQGHGGARG